jgi:hypothetical protein
MGSQDCQDHRTELVDLLEQSIMCLSENANLYKAMQSLKGALAMQNAASIIQAADSLLPQLELIGKLTDAVDKIDPHKMEPAQFKKLRRMRPTKLIEGALAEGKLRERRIILQAKEAATNRLLAYAAFLAAIIALAIPFITHYWLK